MSTTRFFPPLKILSVIVLVAMIAAACYAFGIALLLWSGISV